MNFYEFIAVAQALFFKLVILRSAATKKPLRLSRALAWGRLFATLRVTGKIVRVTGKIVRVTC